MKAVLALYRAQAREFLRDSMALIFVILLPVILGVFFGLMFSGNDTAPPRIGVINEDPGATGGQLVDALYATAAGMDVELWIDSHQKITAALDGGHVQAIILLPTGLSLSLVLDQPVYLTIFYDPAELDSAGFGLEMARTLLTEAQAVLRPGSDLLRERLEPVDTHPLSALEYHLPGMLGVGLLWLGVFGTAQPIVAQREKQVLRRFGITPISKSTILVAEVAWRVSVGLLQASMFLLVGYVGFGVGVQNWPAFVGAVLLGSMVFVSMGYVLSGVGRTSESVMGVAQAINFPMMMLSGTLFTTEMLPAFFKPIVNFIPLTYLGDLLRQSMVDAAALNSMAVDFAVLSAWLVGFVTLAILLWRWE